MTISLERRSIRSAYRHGVLSEDEAVELLVQIGLSLREAESYIGCNRPYGWESV